MFFIGIIAAALVLGGAVCVFFYFYLKRMWGFWFGKCINRKCININKRITHICILVFSLCLAVLSLNIFGIAAIILLHVIFIQLVLDLVSLPIRAAEKRKGSDIKILSALYKCGLLPIIAAAIAMVYGYYNINNVHRTEYTVYTDKHIDSGSFRMLLVSDLHFGNAADADKLEEYCLKMSSENADAVLLCGDIVDEDTSYSEMEKAFELLGGISNWHGIYFTFGNHDKATYSRNADYTEQQLREAIEKNGIIILEDTYADIKNGIVIAGRQDLSQGQRASAYDIMQSISENGKETGISESIVVMMDHQPSSYAEEKAAGTDITVSGHTHDGQIWPAGYLIDLLKTSDLRYGYIKDGDFNAIVTSGISAWGYPIRTQGISEYVVIDIAEK